MARAQAGGTTLSPRARAAFVLALATLSSAATLLVKGSESHKSRPIEHHTAGHHGQVNNTTGLHNNTAAGSDETDGPAYSPFTLTLVVEIVKFVTCVVVVCVGRARERKAASSDQAQSPVAPTEQPQLPLTFTSLARESLWYAVPSALYMIDNNLLYYILNYLDAATHILLWQLKIPITAVLFRVLLNHPLSKLKWCALALLFSGVLTTQSSNPEIIAQMASGGTGSRRAIGVTLVLIGVFVSAAAGVYTEWVLKRRARHNFFVQNSLLYVWGIVFNLLGLVTRDLDKVMEKGLFVGCTWFCPTIILVNAAVGLSYAVVFKYVDNIATLYAHVLSMLMIVLASWLLFNLHLSLALLCGFTTCILSLWLYHHKPVLVPANAPKGGPMYTPVGHSRGTGGAAASHSDSDDSDFTGSRDARARATNGRAALRNRGSSDQGQGDLELMDLQLPDVDDV